MNGQYVAIIGDQSETQECAGPFARGVFGRAVSSSEKREKTNTLADRLERRANR